MLESLSVDGLILAGGQSLRMGRDKALLPVAGRALLLHQVAQMCPVVGQLFVAPNVVPLAAVALANPGTEAGAPGVVLLPDALPGREGPLAGVLPALQASSAGLLWIMPCDTFGLGAPVLAALHQALQESGADIAYARQGDDDHPLLALWRTSVRDALQTFLAAGGRSVFRWYATQHVVAVDIAQQAGQCFNLNTPQDYQQLLEGLAAGDSGTDIKHAD